MYRWSAVLLLCVSMLVPNMLFAQGIPNGTTVTITANPRYPKPNEPITLTLEVYGVIFTDADIAWYADSAKQPIAVGTRSITYTAPAFGTVAHISAIIGRAGTAPLIADYDIIPTVFDLVTESDTVVSPFFNLKMGVPENNRVAVSGILHRSRESGAGYSYRFDVGDGDSPTLNGQRVIFTMPQYETTLIAHVYDAQGTEIYTGASTLTPATPRILIYPYSDIGIAAHPLGATYVPVSNTEMFYAEVLNSPHTVTPTWTINGEVVTAALTNPRLLTLSSLSETSARVGISFPYGDFDTGRAEAAFDIVH